MDVVPNARQFHIPPSFVQDDTVCIPLGNLYRQMVQVLRLQRSEHVRFFDGVGHVFDAHIAHINRDGIIATIDGRSQQSRGQQVTLAIGILKNDRMRWVLEKATELGASTIVPLLTERVVKRPDVSPPRWEFIVKEAAEQSGRAWLPTVAPVMEFATLMQRADANIIVYHTEGTGQVTAPSSDQLLTIVIGPEGGFTNEEIALAQKRGATIASLGVHQLRADTAALAALVMATR